MGYPILDAIASLVICIFIEKAAIDIFKDAINKMVDKACDDETEHEMYECVMKNESVRGVDLLRTRTFGNKIYVDIEIRVDGKLTLWEAHAIAESVHDSVETEFSKVKHIMVHVNPCQNDKNPVSGLDVITYGDETTDKTATVNGVRVCKVKAYVDDMTNLQKLYALANYINNTTHYPGAGCTKKDINPTFYNDFSVDGIGLFYYLFPMPTLNRVMDLQGGITTCIGVTVVQRAATEDLKLPYLYDSSTKTVADGEGVWLAVGSASSNPSVGSHYSVIYKDANEHKSFVDCQGLIADTTCEQHGCRAKVIQ